MGTPAWVARDGDSLVVFTPLGAGKLKGLQHTKRVEGAPSSRRGTVDVNDPSVEAVAQIDPSAPTLRHVSKLLSAKHGVEYELVMPLEKGCSQGLATVT